MTAVRSARNEPGGALALVISRRFGPLFETQFLSAFNDNALRNALVLMIAYRADAAAALSAQMLIPLATGVFVLPFFLCSATRWTRLTDPPDQAARDPGEGAGHSRPAPFRRLSGRCRR